MGRSAQLLTAAIVLAVFATAMAGGNMAGDGMECLVCEWSLAKAEGFISSNTTELVIESLLDRICNYIPSVTSICIDFVAEYFPYLVNLLISKETPAVICKQLKLCTQFVLP